MKSSMEKLGGHVPQIERANYELNGFLTIFAGMSEGTRAKVLKEVAKLKAESGSEAELLENVRALAALYGALDYNETERKGRNQVSDLTFKLGQIQEAATELAKLKPKSGSVH